MDSPLAHIDRAVSAWSARGSAVRDEIALGQQDGEEGLEDAVQRHLDGAAHEPWEGGEDDGIGE